MRQCGTAGRDHTWCVKSASWRWGYLVGFSCSCPQSGRSPQMFRRQPVPEEVVDWALMGLRCFSDHGPWSFIESPDFLLGEGNGTPLQYSCLENPMDGGAWLAAVHGVAKSRTRLSDFTFTIHFHALEKEMTTHSSVLAWRIPGTGEPGGLPSMGSHGVRHDWSDLAAAAADFLLWTVTCAA